MSAICGIFQRTGAAVQPEHLHAMLTALAVYGPDGSQTWPTDRLSPVKPIALGHQHLHVTPESVNHRLADNAETAGLTISADARLDNRHELCETLGVAPDERATLSDSQLIVRAYRKWATDCPVHLLGDFAFAIWDAHQQRLFCARDHLGLKPFYYHATPDCFVFATSIKGVLAAPVVPADIDQDYLAAVLCERNYNHPQYTFYQHLHKLQPGHRLCVQADRFELRAYWTAADSPAIQFATEADYIERLRELLAQAVVARLRCPYPVGAHLSGGLDSSSIAVLAGRHLRQHGQTLHTYAWSAPPPPEGLAPDDERQLIETIVQQEGLAVQYMSATEQDLVALQARDLTCEPTMFFREETAIRRLAHEQHIRVLLSGWGGDELLTFNGRGYFAELFLAGQWPRLISTVRQQAAIQGGHWWLRLYDRVLVPLLPDPFGSWLVGVQQNWRRNRQRALKVPVPDPMLQTRYKAAVHLHRPSAREQPGVHAQQLRLLANGHLQARIEAWADQAAPFGLEYRYPLLDKRLVEFSLGIPSDLFYRHGWKRYLFRQAMAGILPDSVRWNKTKQEPSRKQANQQRSQQLRTQAGQNTTQDPLLALVRTDDRS